MNLISNNKKDFDKVNAMIQALDNTGVRMFMYYPQTKTISVPEMTCEAYQCQAVYENMPHSFADDYVHEDDYPQFKEMYYKIDAGANTATAIFHSKDLNFCNHVTLTTVTWTQDGKPEEVFGLIENMSEQFKSERVVDQLREELAEISANDEVESALKTMAASIASQYFAVYYIWLKDHTYVCFQEQLHGILSLIGERGSYEPAWDAYIKGYIEEEDQPGIREFIDIETIAERIGHKNTITYIYRRKEIGWTRGQFIVGERDENGMPLTLIYTVTDINEEVETRIKKNEAEREALQDHLTGLWNRKAFEQFKERSDFKAGKTGIMLFDIDRFKDINDQYGHDEGDRVIKTVAQEVLGVLRQRDIVFRMGGDEFAVLLYNCSDTIWNTICKKLETIHLNINRLLPEGMNVTISAGVCINKDGYRDDMYSLADRAMYNTKSNGRGGCSLINLNGEITDEWHDDSGMLRKGDVLEKNSTVTWRAEIPKDPRKPIRGYGDSLFLRFLGLDAGATPEEIYNEWLSRLKPEYYDVVKKASEATKEEGQAEALYLWNHPDKGVVQLRCSSSLDSETDDSYTIIGYIHITKDVHVFTIEDVHSKIKDALEVMFFCNFYIRLNDYSFEVYKAQPYMNEMLGSSGNAIDAVDSYIKYMVADESKDEMKEFFDLTTIRERMKSVNLLQAKYNDPAIGLSRARFVAVDRNQNGDVESVSLVVEAIS